MPYDNYLQSEMSGVFLMDACGSRPNFQGCLRITGLERLRGTITTNYCRVGGERRPIAQTQGAPEPIKPTVEAPVEILWSWFNRLCPFTVTIGYKKCRSGAELTKWDDNFDRLIYLPNAAIERDSITTNLSLGVDDDGALLEGSVGLNVDDWILWEQHDAFAQQTDWVDQINAIAFCGGPLCAACTSSCVQPYDPGCDDIWVGGDDGLLFLSTDGGLTWTNKEGSGAGQLDLSDATYGQLNVLAIYCDRNVVIVSTEDGCLHYSHDGGDNWTTLAACPYMTVAFAEYLGNIFAAGNGLWVSKDNGETWTELLTGTFLDVYFDGMDGVAITATDTSVSDDGGATWGTITASGLTGQDSVWLVDCRLWVMGSDGASYTDDYGENWTPIDTDEWHDQLWENCYVGYRVGIVDTTDVLQFTLDGGCTWWNMTVHGLATETLDVLAGCYDKMAIGGSAGFFALMTSKDSMIADSGC